MIDQEKIIIQEMLMSGSSVGDIANKISKDYLATRALIKSYGLDWIVNKNRKLSKGHTILFELFKELFPNREVVTEYHIGEKLYLDIYCKSLNIGAEYHGIQHFEYNSFFHKNKADFKRGQENDLRKINKCKNLGIALVVFSYNDELNLSAVTDRILTAIDNTEEIEPPKTNYSKLSSKNEYYQKAKLLRNQQRRELYKKMKKGK